MENRVSASVSTMAKSGSMISQGDQSNLLQSLVSDLKSIVLDQKFFRPGEQKKAVCSLFGLLSDDTIPANINSKAVSIPSSEDLKHARAGLVESMNRARDRGKAFGEAVSKINKYFSSILKKRYRADVVSGELSNGGSMRKSASQTTNEFEPGILKSEERVKGPVPSRRIRTSMLEPRMDVRANTIPKPPGLPEKDRDTFKVVSGGSEEKARSIPSGVDGWEKPNMKRKRSVIKPDVSGNSLVSKLLDGDREPKRGMQQKLPIDTRPRISNGHAFRSGSVSVANANGSSDLASAQNAIGMRSSSRVDQDISGPHDRRQSRITGLDKEGASHISGNRGPRSNPSLVPKSSQNSQRYIRNSEHLELPQCTDRVVMVNGTVTRKRTTSTQSFSTPVAQWGGQRPQKISRVARRSNAPSLVSCHDGLLLPDAMESTSFGDDSLEKGRHISSNLSQQNKLKTEFLSTTGLSESDDSGIADNNSNNKIKKCSQIEEKDSKMVQNVVPVVPPRRTKIGVDEDLGDGFRRGRHARALVSSRSSFPATLEKSDNAIDTKPMRSGRLGSEKAESKLGRPSNKKMTERKGYARSKPEVDSEVAGDSDDDFEELLAAANAALETRGACSTSFWKQIEPIFASISADDEAFLKEQVDLRNASLSTCPSLSGKDNTDALFSEISYEKCNEKVDFVNCRKRDEPFLGQFAQKNGAQNGFSICQALLSAIIEEEEVDRFYSSLTKDEYLQRCSYGLQSECDAGMEEKVLNVRPLNDFQINEGIAANGCKSPSWRYYDEVECEKLVKNDCIQKPGIEDILSIKSFPNGPSRGQRIISNSVSSEVQYSQMSVTDRILWELNGIGLFPDPVPDLAQSEDEDILEGITNLDEKLQEEVKKKKNLLLKVEKAVAGAKEHQDREIERIAMSIHIARAYEKHVQACSKNANRVTKQATLGLVKRALSRYREFELTGSSCFREPAFKNIFCSAPSVCLSEDLTNIAVGTKAFGTVSFGPLQFSDDNSPASLKSIQITDTEDKHCSVLQPVQIPSQEEQRLDRTKKRELLLDDVVGANTGNLRPPSNFGSSLSSGTKGKRSERDGRGHTRNGTSRSGTVKTGQPSASNPKGERKNKSKPKQRTAQLTASVNGLVCNSETKQEPHSVLNSHGSEDDKSKDAPSLPLQDLLNDNDTLNFNNHLSELAGNGGQGQDFAAWLSSVDEEDSLQEHNCMGLDIPMDDLSEVMMM